MLIIFQRLFPLIFNKFILKLFKLQSVMIECNNYREDKVGANRLKIYAAVCKSIKIGFNGCHLK